MKRPALLLAVVFAASPLFAGGPTAVVALARENAGFQQALRVQAAQLPVLTRTPSLIMPNLRPAYFENAPGTPEEAGRFEAKKALFGLLADPDAAAERAAMAAAIGVAPETLESAAGALQAQAASNPALARQLEMGRAAARAADAQSIAKVFDGITPGASASAAPSAASLEAYLAGTTKRGGARTATTVRGFKEAIFDAGHYEPSHDAELQRLGYHAVVIQDPSREELEGREGFDARSPKIRWMVETADHEKRLAAIKGALKKSAAVTPEVKTLTVDDYENIFFPLYKETIESKPGGKVMLTPDFASHELAEKGSLDDWKFIVYRDPAEPSKVIGGMIVNLWTDRQFATMSYGGYLHEARQYELGTRSFAESMKIALAHGLPLLSFGMDWNMYGIDTNIGLAQAKSKTGMVPFPNGPLQLFKMIDGAKVREGNNAAKQDGFLYFALNQGGALIERYLALRTDSEVPQTHQLIGEPYFGPDALQAAALWTVRYLSDDPAVQGTTKIPFKTPEGLPIAAATALP